MKRKYGTKQNKIDQKQDTSTFLRAMPKTAKQKMKAQKTKLHYIKAQSARFESRAKEWNVPSHVMKEKENAP